METSEQEADIILINTCAFIDDAKEQSINETLRLARLKSSSPSKRLVLFGCLGQRYKGQLATELPEVDLIEGINGEEQIVAFFKGPSGPTIKGSPQGPKEVTPKEPTHYAYLKIADGCNRRCTFCVIPSIKGRFKSVPKGPLLQEATRLIDSGARELILIGQDITEYGRDGLGYGLVDLLREMVALEGDFYIRLLYLNPTGITNQLLELMATERKIIHYIDVPLQHSEERILRLMGRQGTKKEYIRLIRNIRRIMPDIALRTTFIVGFPSETEEEFQSLLDFVGEIGFDRLGAFRYSREDGTTAARLKGQIPKAVKDRRYDALMGLQAEISYQKNLELVGRTFDVLVDEVDAQSIIGRIYSQATDIDGATIIDLRNSDTKGQKVRTGDRIRVKITGAYEYDLLGEFTV